MDIALRNTKGIKKVIKQIKELDIDAKTTNYEHTIYIASDRLVALVNYDMTKNKVRLTIYRSDDHDKEIDVSISMIECLYRVN